MMPPWPPAICSRRLIRSAIGGWVAKSFAMPPPRNGLAIMRCETSTRWVFGWFGLALSLLPDWDSMGALYGPLLFYGRASPGDRLALLLCRALGAAPPR